MGKTVLDAVLDAAHDEIKDNCTKIVLCSQEPTTFAEANVTYMLAEQTVDGTDFTVAGSIWSAWW